MHCILVSVYLVGVLAVASPWSLDAQDVFYQGLAVPYVPRAGDLHGKDEYLPPVEYLPSDFNQDGALPVAQHVAAPADPQDPNCCQRQVSTGSDIPVDLPKVEPEGYDYPKPTKRLELPSQELQVPTPARTLDQELPLEGDVSWTTTEAVETTTIPLPEDKSSDVPRLVRSSQDRPKSRKLDSRPESGVIHIQTLPFMVNHEQQIKSKRQVAQTFPARRPVQAQPLPARRPVQAQPLPARLPVQAQPLPARRPVQAQPLPARLPVQAQPLPARRPVQAQPLPAPRPGQPQFLPAIAPPRPVGPARVGPPVLLISPPRPTRPNF